MNPSETLRPQQAAGLERLAARVRHDLETLDYFAPDWVRPRMGPQDEPMLDVAIVGGGQSGLGAAFGLLRERVRNILVLDENPAGLEGPWATYARMVTLRTPKHLTGIDLGVPSLTFRAWWEAQFGLEAWEALGKIPKEEWMRYLRWYREVLDLPVRNGAKVERVEPLAGGGFRLIIAGAGAPARGYMLARKVIFATGIQGGGEWHVPPLISDNLPSGRYAHTSEAVDYAALRGKRIGILGGGASAFDNAQHALGQGVGEAHVFLRRREMPRVNPIRQMEVSGMIRHYAALDDARKYASMRHFLNLNQPPTNDTFDRAAAYPGFRLHLGSPWLSVREADGVVRVETPKGGFDFDFVVLSTGLLTDVALRPELAAVRDDIALWTNRYKPPRGQANTLLDQHPYLGPGFEFTAKGPEGQPRVWGLFAFNYSALASLGLSASALSGLKVALPKLASSVSAQLFLDDQDQLVADFLSYDETEFTGQWPAN